MKGLTAVCIAILCVVGMVFPAYGFEEDTGNGLFVFDFDEQLEQIGGNQLVEELPEAAEEFLDALEMDELSIKNLIQMTPSQFFKAITTLLWDAVKKPIVTLASVIGIVIICALLGGMKDSIGDSASLTPIFNIVAALCVSTVIAMPVIQCIQDTGQAIREFGVFMTAFIPMFTGVITAAGQPLTAITYNMFMFSACQIAAQFTVTVLVPLLGIYIAFCLIGSVMPDVDILSVAGIIKSAITWVLGLMLSLFVGLMSVQSIVASSGDTATTKAAKFLIGSVVPVVGSALSDAFIAAQGCIKLLKTTLGGFGILAAAFTFLPVLLRVVVWYITINVASAVGGILGVKQVSNLLKTISTALGILLSIILCFALLIVVTTTILLLLGVNI